MVFLRNQRDIMVYGMEVRQVLLWLCMNLNVYLEAYKVAQCLTLKKNISMC